MLDLVAIVVEAAIAQVFIQADVLACFVENNGHCLWGNEVAVVDPRGETVDELIPEANKLLEKMHGGL